MRDKKQELLQNLREDISNFAALTNPNNVEQSVYLDAYESLWVTFWKIDKLLEDELIETMGDW